MKIVIGLGNPGRRYAGTRHNVGFDVLQELAVRHSAGAWQVRFEAEITEIRADAERALLVAPQTFMNLSGRSVQKVVGFYKVLLADLLVVCDDLNLPPGQLRFREAGSSGGQKGLQNVIEHLGSDKFARLRVGIGRPPGQVETVNYVMQPFSSQERPVINEAVCRAAEAVEVWMREGAAATMNRFNRAAQAGT